jgi:hypothetical protein
MLLHWSSMKNLLRYKDSKNWHYRFYDERGKRRTISLGTDDEAEPIHNLLAPISPTKLR